MKLVFVYYAYENQGSSLDLQGYARAAREMGHEAIVYGVPNPKIPLNYSIDLAGADAVVFVFEWTTDLLYGDRLDWLRLVSSVPRSRRVVIDCDGRYNDPINVHGDFNHRTEAESIAYMDFCDAVADKIYQPTPRRSVPTSAPSCSTSTIRPGRHRSTSPPRISASSTSATRSSAGTACRRCCGRWRRCASRWAASPCSATAGTSSRTGPRP